MEHLRTFSPWIAYFVAGAVGDWRLGLAAGLAVGIGVLVTSEHGIDLISAAGVAFMALLLPVALVRPDSAVEAYTGALALGFLGVAAGVSILVGHPFTEAFARRETPPELWATDLFRRANQVITAGWAISFLATAAVVAGLVVVAPEQVALRIVVQVGGFVAALRFTAWYRARLGARHGLAPALTGASVPAT